MRRTAIVGVLLFAVVSSSVCIDSERVNRECRWTDARTESLKLDRSADREHLRQDAQVAWEVGQRYADVRYRSNPILAAPLLDSCRAALYDSIGARHGVSRAEIDVASRARLWSVDVTLVFLPMAIAAFFVTSLLAEEVERIIGIAAMNRPVQLIFALVNALIMTGLMQIWAMGVETWRLHNEHIAGRASVVPTVAHPAIAFAAMYVVVMFVVQYRASRLNSDGSRIT